MSNGRCRENCTFVFCNNAHNRWIIKQILSPFFLIMQALRDCTSRHLCGSELMWHFKDLRHPWETLRTRIERISLCLNFNFPISNVSEHHRNVQLKLFLWLSMSTLFFVFNLPEVEESYRAWRFLDVESREGKEIRLKWFIDWIPPAHKPQPRNWRACELFFTSTVCRHVDSAWILFAINQRASAIREWEEHKKQSSAHEFFHSYLRREKEKKFNQKRADCDLGGKIIPKWTSKQSNILTYKLTKPKALRWKKLL